jgi:hypothetical protein
MAGTIIASKASLGEKSFSWKRSPVVGPMVDTSSGTVEIMVNCCIGDRESCAGLLKLRFASR